MVFKFNSRRIGINYLINIEVIIFVMSTVRKFKNAEVHLLAISRIHK